MRGACTEFPTWEVSVGAMTCLAAKLDACDDLTAWTMMANAIDTRKTCMA